MDLDPDDTPYASTSRLPPPGSRPSRQRTRTTKGRNQDGDSPGPKLKLKIGGGRVQDSSAIGWDRELDSDPDEPLAVEEHFILRVPPALAPQLKEMVMSREVGPDVWFKFKDSRRAVFHMGEKLYGAKLVDLPTLVESQKLTGTGGQSIKVADISQMLLVEEEVQDEGQVTKERAFNIEDFIYPHGVTPPLKHVRKRRFRKRANKRTIEIVESAVEKLLEQDARCEKVEYELLDHDVSDDEFGSPGAADARPHATPGVDNDLDSLGAPTPGAMDSLRGDEDMGDAEIEVDDEEDEGFDSDLANEINKGLEAMNASASEAEDDGSDGEGLFGASSEEEEEEEEEEEDPETTEQRRRIKLLAEETGDLERAIAVKEGELSKAPNPIFKKRFEEMIKKLTVERDLKKAQHATAVREMEKKKAGDAAAAENADAAAAAAVAAKEAEGGAVAPADEAMDES